MAQGFNSPEKSKMLILPEKANYAQSQLYDYLCNKRNIDSRIVTTLLNENKIYEDKRGNIVFVGFDEKNKPRFASLRGTSGITQFRMDCAGSDKQYGFNMTYTQSELLYVFESPIDAMSHATLTNLITGDKDSWRSDNRLSLAGTSDTALIFFLNKHSAVKQLIFCLDNDPAGREASVVMARRYAENGYYTRIELPESKDFNEDLLDITVKRKIENTKL